MILVQGMPSLTKQMNVPTATKAGIGQYMPALNATVMDLNWKSVPCANDNCRRPTMSRFPLILRMSCVSLTEPGIGRRAFAGAAGYSKIIYSKSLGFVCYAFRLPLRYDVGHFSLLII